MKIWKAELNLLNLFDEDFGKGDAYKINFSFESTGEDYEFNDSRTKYSHFGCWNCDTIPVNMTYENTVWGLLKVTQGFTEDKTEEEQEKIKQDMIDYMRECLIKEKNKIIASYDKKIESLK